MQNYISKTQPLIEKAVLEVFPKNNPPTNFVIENYLWENAFSEPFYELFKRGGKRIRPILACLTYHSFGGESDSIYQLATIPEILHTGTLIIDDIEDNSDLRRGKPSIHKLFQNNLTINNGNFLYFFPQLILQKSEITDEQKLKIYEVLNQEMAKLHLGQGMDILWSNQKKYAVNVEEYLQMSEYKTGTLVNLSLQIGGILADQSTDKLKQLENIAYKIGIAFQIQDDILNLQKSEKWGKSYGEDIVEGKLTYLIVTTLEVADQKDKNLLINLLQSKDNSQEQIDQAIQIIEKYNIFEQANQFTQNLIKSVKIEIKDIFIEPKSQKIWLKILDYIIRRKN